MTLILRLAGADPLQQCSRCVAEALRARRANWLPHPRGKIKTQKMTFSGELGQSFFVVLAFDGAHQNVPDILIGSLVAAEANTSTQQALPPPHITGHHVHLADPHGFSAVHLHLHPPLHVGLQPLLQQVVFLILGKSSRRSHIRKR